METYEFAFAIESHKVDGYQNCLFDFVAHQIWPDYGATVYQSSRYCSEEDWSIRRAPPLSTVSKNNSFEIVCYPSFFRKCHGSPKLVVISKSLFEWLRS